MRAPWTVLVLILVVLGLLSGVTGMVVAPIVAAFLFIAFVVWLLLRVLG